MKTVLIGLILASALLTGCDRGGAPVMYQAAVAKLLQSADTLQQSGNNEGALCRLSAAAELAPNLFAVQYNIGVIHSAQHAWALAIPPLKLATASDAKQASGFVALARAYRGWGDTLRLAAKPGSKPPAGTSGLPATPTAAYQLAVSTYSHYLTLTPDDNQAKSEMEATQALITSAN